TERCWLIPLYIQNFGLKDPDVLIGLAKQCAQQDPIATISSIDNFGIKNQSVLFDIAKQCAQLAPSVTVKCIRNFGIEDQRHLIEIAKLCAQRDGFETANNISNFQIKNQKARREILLLALQQNPRSIMYWNSANLDGEEKLPRIYTVGIYNIQINVDEPEEIVNSYIEEHFPGKEFKDLLQKIADRKVKESELKGLSEGEKQRKVYELEENKKRHLQWLGSALFLLRQTFTDDQIKWVAEKGLLNAIQEFRRPDLQWPLTLALSKSASEPKAIMAWDNLPCSKFEEKHSWLKLAHLLGAQLVGQGCEETVVSQLLEVVGGRKGSIFMDALKHQILLETLLHLANEQNLTSNEKSLTLKRALLEMGTDTGKKKEERLLRSLRYINCILLFGTPEFLKDSKIDLQDALEQSIRSKVPIEGIDNFAEKYLKEFGDARDPTAIITYASKVASLNDPQAAASLGKYISNVLRGDFQNVRNSLENNPHLRKIHEYNPEFLEKWGQKVDMIELSKIQSSGKEAEFSPEKWLKEKLIDNTHLGKLEETCPLLQRYLTASTDEEKKTIRQELSKKMEQSSSLPKEDPERIRLSVQSNCMQIISAKNTPDCIGKLKSLKVFLEKAPFNKPEFLNDVEGLQRQLSKQKAETKLSKFVAIETEDYMDLLLCGTEVDGSCQRVGGDASLNKGLLGYLLDGKNRLLAIKTEKGPKGRIEARCLLRLLWDGKQPVLLRERFYPHPIHPDYEKTLNKLAQSKAEALGVPLVSFDEKGGKYPRTLEALGGPAPFEYSDAGGGVKWQGTYTVSNARFLTAE
ncbi:MAG: hypothetical protein K940chlam7_01046, partial [Chlamydiae bacterium]|nr:hypothetical protein [Chlamydiota bacterium]